VPGSEGRQTFRRRPLSHFTISTISNTESTSSHRECLLPSCPNLNYAVWPPYLILLPAYRNTLSALCDMPLSGLVPVSVSFYILLTDGSSQSAFRSRSLTTSIPIPLAVSTWNGPPTKSVSAVDLTVERKRCFQRTIMHGSNLGSCPGSTPYFKQTLIRRYNPVHFMLGRSC
jgi:hypothetical protein